MFPSGDRKLSRRAALGAVGGAAFGTAAIAVPAPPPQPAGLTLELRADPWTVRFANAGRDPVRILKPLDGSEYCWIMPHYRFTVIGENDHEVGYLPRCAMFGLPYFGTKWPSDYLVTIPGGGEYTVPVGLHRAIREAGIYRVRLEYQFTPKVPRAPGGPWPDGLWVGSVTSNTIEMRLTPSS